MSQQALAAASGVSHSTIKDFESEKRSPIPNNLAAIEQVFEKKGIRFFDLNDQIGIAAPSPGHQEKVGHKTS